MEAPATTLSKQKPYEDTLQNLHYHAFNFISVAVAGTNYQVC